MSRSHAILRVLRKLHLYIGVFTTPALLFFAITGAMQTFSLHETTQGSSYKPPAWIATLAQLHKKQTTVVPPRRIRPAGSEARPEAVPENTPGNVPRERQRGDTGSRAAASGPADAAKTASSEQAVPSQAQSGPPRQPRTGEAAGPATPRKSHLPMKIFFLLVS